MPDSMDDDDDSVESMTPRPFTQPGQETRDDGDGSEYVGEGPRTPPPRTPPGRSDDPQLYTQPGQEVRKEDDGDAQSAMPVTPP